MVRQIRLKSKELPLCEVITAYGSFPVGFRFRPNGMLRQALLRKKIIKIVDESSSRKANKLKKTEVPSFLKAK